MDLRFRLWLVVLFLGALIATTGSSTRRAYRTGSLPGARARCSPR